MTRYLKDAHCWCFFGKLLHFRKRPRCCSIFIISQKTKKTFSALLKYDLVHVAWMIKWICDLVSSENSTQSAVSCFLQGYFTGSLMGRCGEDSDGPVKGIYKLRCYPLSVCSHGSCGESQTLLGGVSLCHSDLSGRLQEDLQPLLNHTVGAWKGFDRKALCKFEAVDSWYAFNIFNKNIKTFF